ncbi:CPBP family intramembrane glutamic endopeptidase [Macrococcus equipercicus]|uniref:CPBP family intramembrane metalloprotease n=1 Tax=Macrococcus equipercicus TaxID=69967 RepID=A0A9Q9F2Q8_9STAP|nr:type II CAAX endopeptidase family protein [Macrococcus equipercicus]KAA1036938.1 CPBP family intramembrane metalloprotease [Macrococcus equipercicus]UTH14651.1 CPBP family intramembrane metalloprotease [Macrococcus equipercicus]
MKLNHSMQLSTNHEKDPRWWTTILWTIAAFLIGPLIATLIAIPVILMVDQSITLDELMNSNKANTYLSLLGFPATLLLIFIINKFFYRHPVGALGFFGRQLPGKYVIGALLGAGAILLEYDINLLAGALSTTVPAQIEWLTVIGLTLGFMVQGLTEEVICRGFIMNKISRQLGVMAGILINSLLFAALHLMNSNMSILTFINLLLAGIVFSLLFYWTDNIWLTGAAHSFWNIMLGVVLGIEVSGEGLPASVVTTVLHKDMTLLNGGFFGLEGGIVDTALSIVLIIVLWRLAKRKYQPA